MKAIHYFRRLVSVLVAVSILWSCAKEKGLATTPGDQTNYIFELKNSYSLGWTRTNFEGIDSYIGQYKKGEAVINFEFGMRPKYEDVKQTSDMTYFEETAIDGYPAKLFAFGDAGNETFHLFIDGGTEFSRGGMSSRYTNDRSAIFALYRSFAFTK